MKTTIILAAIAASSMAGNFYALNQYHRNAVTLDTCARELNVYACKAVAAPVEAPRIVTVTAPMLPPPVLAQVEGR